MIMVAIQAAHGDALPVSLQLPSHITVFAAVVRLDRKTTVSPQLALGTETVRRLQQRHQQSGTNRADRRNLAQQLHGRMLATLAQQIASRFLAHRLQQIQLLIQPFRSPANSGLRDLGQPLRAMPRGIDGRTTTRNGPASIESLDPSHDSRSIRRGKEAMTTPWRSVQDAEKANETVAWQALPCRLAGVAYPNTEKSALAHVI